MVENMQEKRLKVRNNSIDLVKWMASLLVVSVHSDAFSDISPLMGHIINSVFGRMVVPFFACVTGYYLTEYSVEKPKMWLKNLKSLFKYYVLLSVIYVAWDAVCHHFSGMSVENIIYTVVKRFVIYGTYYHLWFFPSMMVAVVVLHFSLKWKKEKLCWILCILGFIFGSLTYTWYGLILWEKIPLMNRLMVWYDFLYIRRFITCICPFAFLGNFLSYQKNIWINACLERKFPRKIAVLMIIWILMDIAEVEVANYLGFAEGTTGSFCLLPAILFLFLFLLMHPAKTKRMTIVGYYSGKASIILYGFHPLVLELICKLMNFPPTVAWCMAVLFLCTITWGWQQRYKLYISMEKR